MESKGKYWVPVFNLLEDEINVVIANPKWVKAVKGNKDDTKDSKWIGDLFRLGLVKGSYIPCKIVRILREYTRYRYKLVSCRSSEKNRYQNTLTVCNVALDSVVSDIFGKSSMSIINIVDFCCDIIHMCADEAHTIFLGISHLISFDGFYNSIFFGFEAPKKLGCDFFVVMDVPDCSSR